MILRRRDDLARVMRELGGQLFATEGQVDRYFGRGIGDDAIKVQKAWNLQFDVLRDATHVARDYEIKRAIEQHIRWGPAREAEALRRANIRQVR